MLQPLVSILIPAYNHVRYVGRALESALGQTYGHLELIAIDDASQDDTWAVLESFQDERLQRHRHIANRGASATLNEALALARGEYIAILNSDDVYDSRRIERLLAEAARLGEREALIFSDIDFIDSSGNKIFDSSRAQSYRALRSDCEALSPISWFFAGNPAMSTSNFFFSRVLAERVGDFSPLRYTHDWEWALRTIRYGMPCWVREKLLAYRVHETNTLSEDDRWRHIHENSYVQARALLSLPRAAEAGWGTSVAAEEFLSALMKNESLHPISLLCYMVYSLAGGDRERLLNFTVGREPAEWLLARVADTVTYPQEIFYSLRQLAEQVNALAAQAAMLEERWQAMEQMRQEIASRDRWIADLNAFLEEKERCIAGQAAMIEERWNIIQHMSSEIANRDRQIEALQAELTHLNRHPLVRAIKYIKRTVTKLLAP